jgi:hypothetical protein
MKKQHFLLGVLLFLGYCAYTQESAYKVGCIGFYNLENLFDTLDTPTTNDADFLPNGAYAYNTSVYVQKLHNLDEVISQLGVELTPDGVSVLGVAEVENRLVLEDLVKQERLKGRNYKIVHYDSPDERGIDVGLLYQPKYFSVLDSRPIRVPLPNEEGKPNTTRDVLLVSGLYDGEPMHIMVNHWPSRRGGEEATRPLRNLAASICKHVADSLMLANPQAKVIVMGDLNDDPVNESLSKILDAKGDPKKVKKGGMYNPMYAFFKKGIGTMAYNDAWSLFDNMVLSYGFLNKGGSGYQFYKARVFNENFLVQKTGQYKGYPHRTFAGNVFINGYSDHFPVYCFIRKPIK